MGNTEKCKKCKGRYKNLVHGVCANCDFEAWNFYWRKKYNVKKNK